MSRQAVSTPPPADVDVAALLVALAGAVDGDVRFDPGARHLHAADASNYRHLPLGVVAPRSVDALATTVEVCARRGVPITMRGGGTSLAGQATGRGVVVDTSRYLTEIIEIDPDARTARVQPGVVLSDLQRVAGAHGLRFGPDPSTANRATIGGMLGNDACGPHSLRFGRTSDNTHALAVVTGDGHPTRVGHLPLMAAVERGGHAGRDGDLWRGLVEIRDRVSDLVAARVPTDLPRLVSGLHLDQLCREDGLHAARSLVGSEGTCVVVTEATVGLVARPAATALAVLGFPDDVAAARMVPALRAGPATALEGMDRRLVTGAARRGSVPGLALLPEGDAWLVVEVDGAHPDVAATRARSVAVDAGVPSAIVTSPSAQRAVWQVRAAGLGAVTYTDGEPPALPGWEDAAVPPGRLADYLAGLHGLLDAHGLTAGIYGHYGDGCVHTKIGFDHTTDAGRARFRAFVEQAADLTVSLGGSLSGEHGDGQARGELLVRMFGEELVDAMRVMTRLWDPAGVLNPGRLVDAWPLDADLRTADRQHWTVPDTALAFRREGGAVGAFDRCVGAGTCRRDDDIASMCPSYRATHDEAHSTRGRARLLGEVLRPDTTLSGFGDSAVVDALELCLSCKACAAECPVEVDMATLKAEAAHQRHDVEGHRRPAASWLLGHFRELSRVAGVAPTLATRAARSVVGRAVWGRVGLARQRSLPPFAPRPFRASWRTRQRHHPTTGPTVVLFVDTFTDVFAPHVAIAAVRVLERRGHRVAAVTDVCCGRPRYAEGMLDAARGDVDDLVDRLDGVGGDAPIVWLEPSCLSVARDELADLRDDAAAGRVAQRSRSLAELVLDEGWQLTPRPAADGPVAFHPHCHHRASIGTGADAQVLASLGVDARDLDAGCCGLAGSFGFVDGGRYDVSVAVAEDRFAPRLRDLPAGARVLMDGFSCREQAAHLRRGPGAPGRGPGPPRPVTWRTGAGPRPGHRARSDRSHWVPRILQASEAPRISMSSSAQAHSHSSPAP